MHAVGDEVDVRADVLGHRLDASGTVIAVFPGSPQPYGVSLVENLCYVRASARDVTGRTTYTDVDGSEWLPCHDGNFVAIDGDGYQNPRSLTEVKNWFGPLRANRK